VQPIVTPEQMGAIDAAAPEPVEVLIGRAGAAVARAALQLLGGTYGRRVVVLAGKGNNGNDGRAAAARLRRRGVQVEVLDAAALPPAVPPCDLVVDAAYGTGFRGTFEAPEVGDVPVLAVDVPSGVSGLTGEASGRTLRAVRTVTFAALKPGLLLGPGAELAGEVEVADIGLDVSSAPAHLVEDVDVAEWLPDRPVDSHKWKAAVWVVAGSPGMTGAAHLSARAAQRAGAGYVRLSTPGVDDDPQRPTEAVGHALAAAGWDRSVLVDLERFGALVIGPGLGRGEASAAATHHVVTDAPLPVVVDGDGLAAFGADARSTLAKRVVPAVLTPHDGEFERLAGHRPGPDRLEEARGLAARLESVVLLKGTTTVAASPDGEVLVVTSGDARLATAGTGDVLSGLVGAFLAQGMPPLQAAAAAAHVHGRAATLGWPVGLVAGDLPDLVPPTIASIRSAE
jgi:NAD(P)H-hydrate epimerase